MLEFDAAIGEAKLGLEWTTKGLIRQTTVTMAVSLHGYGGVAPSFCSWPAGRLLFTSSRTEEARRRGELWRETL